MSKVKRNKEWRREERRKEEIYGLILKLIKIRMNNKNKTIWNWRIPGAGLGLGSTSSATWSLSDFDILSLFRLSLIPYSLIVSLSKIFYHLFFSILSLLIFSRSSGISDRDWLTSSSVRSSSQFEVYIYIQKILFREMNLAQSLFLLILGQNSLGSHTESHVLSYRKLGGLST